MLMLQLCDSNDSWYYQIPAPKFGEQSALTVDALPIGHDRRIS